jgi:N-carbamoyl-L-amino-acid hydrolase
MIKFKPKLERVKRDIQALSRIIDKSEPGYTRIAFSEEDRLARNYLADLMQKEGGLEVRRDPAANLIGRKEGQLQAPCIMMGSHLDTVRGGGRFDGMLGVISALEVARCIHESNHKMVHPLEVVVFTAEEVSPFGISCVGSRAMAGKLPKDTLHELQDKKGRTLAEGLTELGGDPENILQACRSAKDISNFFELHIEQGSILDKAAYSLGVVTGIVGIYRGQVIIRGRVDHAGTTPMADRVDALCAAAEAVLRFEAICRKMKSVVGTIGKLEVFPNVSNVVPGQVDLVAEIRSLDTESLETVTSQFSTELEKISLEREVTFECSIRPSSNPVKFPLDIVRKMSKVCQDLGIDYIEMPSGAGHDTSQISQITRTGMIFVPSKNGRSHCPDESTEWGHISLGVQLMMGVLNEFDKEELI